MIVLSWLLVALPRLCAPLDSFGMSVQEVHKQVMSPSLAEASGSTIKSKREGAFTTSHQSTAAQGGAGASPGRGQVNLDGMAGAGPSLRRQQSTGLAGSVRQKRKPALMEMLQAPERTRHRCARRSPAQHHRQPGLRLQPVPHHQAVPQSSGLCPGMEPLDSRSLQWHLHESGGEVLGTQIVRLVVFQ